MSYLDLTDSQCSRTVVVVVKLLSELGFGGILGFLRLFEVVIGIRAGIAQQLVSERFGSGLVVGCFGLPRPILSCCLVLRAA